MSKESDMAMTLVEALSVERVIDKWVDILNLGVEEAEYKAKLAHKANDFASEVDSIAECVVLRVLIKECSIMHEETVKAGNEIVEEIEKLL